MFVFRDVSRVHVIPFFQLHPILAGKTVLFPTCSKLDVNGVNFHLCFFGVYKHCFPGKVSIFPNQELGRMSFFCLRCNMLLYVRWAFNIYELFKYTYVTWGKYLYIYIYMFSFIVYVFIYIYTYIYLSSSSNSISPNPFRLESLPTQQTEKLPWFNKKTFTGSRLRLCLQQLGSAESTGGWPPKGWSLFRGDGSPAFVVKMKLEIECGTDV